MSDRPEQIRPPDLLPCPFCASGEWSEHVQRLAPTMRGPGALVSHTIRHWCPRGIGTVHDMREIRGRDRAACVAQWNRRPTQIDCAIEGSARG